MSEEPPRKRLRGSNLVNASDKVSNDQLLFFTAIKKNDTKSLSKFLENISSFKININFTSKNHTTALNLAIVANNYELVKRLIDLGANVNLRSLREHTRYVYYNRLPLHLAVHNGQKKIVELLLQNNADVNSVEDHKTALSIAAEQNHFKIAKLLIDSGAEINPSNSVKPLFSAISRSTSMAEYFIKRGADVNAVGKYWYDPQDIDTTALELAIYRQNPAIMQLLIDKKANVNYKSGQDTLLRIAVITGSVKAVKVLLNCDDISVNAVAAPGISALHVDYITSFYKSNNTKNILTALLDAGIDVNQISYRGENVVDYFKRMSLVIKKPVFQHIVKLKAAGLYVCSDILEAVEGTEYASFYSACCLEVQMMKENKILDINFSFYDLLHKSQFVVALALLIVDQNKCLQERLLRRQFTLYGGLIYYRLKKAFYRKKLLVKVDEILFDIFNAHLPDVIKRMIYLYLSKENMSRYYYLIDKRIDAKALVVIGWLNPKRSRDSALFK
ncbi:hypothetical protein KQX54_016767 [Cotesia glomerata]|uniref:Ankyrin repeat protein n=1 Tax=Cotesia glomerata TaxID=32391 RepID=A0AAV7I5R2_COTGL|nr:hypothetical protein KQX54_016767 [Cotesia glomerata]